MPKAPTTFDDLRTAVRTDREALALAAILPNLPADDRIVDLRGWRTSHGDRLFETDADTIDDLRRRETPVVPGSSLYRVRPDTDISDDYDMFADPVPHGFKTYKLKRCDLVEFVAVDAEDAEYGDTPYHTLDEYGTGSPHLGPSWKLTGEYERKSHLPV